MRMTHTKRKRRFKSANESNRSRTKQRSGKKSKLPYDISMLEQDAIKQTDEAYESKRSIADLPISNELIVRLQRKGFEKPTEIQDRSLEALLAGRDILGIAQTGTGKTAAFLVPIIEDLMNNGRPLNHSLIVVPTRELALQVNEEFKSITKDLKIYSACVIGGTNIQTDIRKLRRAHHLIVGTPGRLLDLCDRRVIDLRRFSTLVLDEFDRMLDMGFARDMDRIIDQMGQRKHTMLFSATLDPSQKDRIREILHDPVKVQVTTGNVTSEHIEQKVIRLQLGEDKFETLCEMLDDDEFSKVLVFDETKHRVKRLCRKLNKRGIKSDEIQGNKSQNARQNALQSFKAGKVQVLVATDVAARGIDVDNVTHVINYCEPRTYDSYIHRIGRTGRAGKTGKAFTFVS